MSIFTLLAGIMLILPVFAGFIWSAAQVFSQRGWLQKSHAAAALLTLAGMAVISWRLEAASQFTGVFLGVATGIAFWQERRWSKLLPAFQFGLALVLILKLPFVANG